MFNDYEVSYQEIMRLEEEITRWRARFFNTDAIAATLGTENARYRMALEIIATETIEPAYSTQIATRWRMIAREAVGEVLYE